MEIRLHGFQKRKRGFCKLEMKPDLAMGKTSSAEFGTSYGSLFGEFLNFFLTRAIGQKSAPRILWE